MTNPVFSNNEAFRDPVQRRGGTKTSPAPTSSPYGQMGTAGAVGADAASLDAMYAAPSATTADTKRLTYDDVIIKTGGLLALLVVVAAATWTLAPQLYIIGAIAGLVLGLVNAFKREPSPLLITLYTVAQGMFLGGLSASYAQFYEGAVPSAIVATIATFAGALLLFKSGKVRVTPKFTKFLLIGMVGYLLFSLTNVVLLMFGSLEGWGLRGGTMGIVISLVAVGLAAMSLIMDFDSIKRGVEAGAPAKFAWAAAFGLLVTLIWLYLEFLRLFAILGSSD
ncbi:Bax inhibitor-1/YccA family protein [Paraoerskovia marina]|uniref:Bax inhibitor-1/YccA family protein n=1 Tax=Paraoerskovia marina TaxID=545619 RepID=UPI000492E76D|nr:Bax inhibitor-1/YccA family protein [Paraoerskovia marina]